MPISVVMPAYNAAAFLPQAIESVLAQTWRDFELIIVDDGSTDETLAIAERYAAQDARIRVYTQPNAGVAPTLNRGLDLAGSEWVFLMHADDLMHPNRLERQLAFIAEHPELAVASSWVEHINSKGETIARDRSPLVTHEAVEKQYRANSPIGISHPAAALRKSAVLAVGGYRAQFRVNEDIDLWNRLLEKGCKILVQPECLLKYRIHGGSASIARARFIRRQMHWVKDCMVRRRRGEQELGWEEYLRYRRTLPWLKRLNTERRDIAKILYKAAVFQFAEGKYHQLIPTAMGAVLLQPGYAIPQIVSKLSFFHQ